MSDSAPEPDEDRLKRAVARLEQAMAEVAAIAGERAAAHVEAAARRWISPAPGSGDDDAAARPSPAEAPARQPEWLWSDHPRTAKLRRDDERGKLFGVCAGIAGYCGLETWVVRCLAIVAVILFNWVAVVGYVVAVFVMDKAPADGAVPRRRGRGRGRRRGRRYRYRYRYGPYGRPAQAGDRRGEQGDGQDADARPRERLAAVQGRFGQLESRLRRLESEVTSGQFDLHRELVKMDRRS